jgi:hypothetical protein
MSNTTFIVIFVNFAFLPETKSTKDVGYIYLGVAVASVTKTNLLITFLHLRGSISSRKGIPMLRDGGGNL